MVGFSKVLGACAGALLAGDGAWVLDCGRLHPPTKAAPNAPHAIKHLRRVNMGGVSLRTGTKQLEQERKRITFHLNFLVAAENRAFV